MAKTAKHREMDMLHGSLAGRLILFALPLAFSSILQQLFNSADVESSAALQAMPRLRQWAAASRSSAFSSI